MTESASRRHVPALEETEKRCIRQRSHDKVRRLVVLVVDGQVVVRGSTSSHYVKQLALEGARAALKNSVFDLRLEIEVMA